MIFRNQIRLWIVAVIFAAALAHAQPKPQPAFTIDLKALGAAHDLFSDQSDSAYPQRAIITAFWLGSDRVAVAFSTNSRWSGNEKPEPLHVRLVTFQATDSPPGKQLNQRDWDVAAEGPAANMTLDLTPGPDGSILAVHQVVASAAGAIPEGDFIQVLNPDTSLQQNFYVPATSAWIPGSFTDSRLLLQSYYADKHVSLAWWGGHPLKLATKLDLPPGKEIAVAGPGMAARPICAAANQCSTVRVFRPGAPPWAYSNSEHASLLPVPRAFLSSTALLIELRDPKEANPQQVGWLVAHSEGAATPLPELPKGLATANVTGVSADGGRFSVDAAGQAGCGWLGLNCRQIARSLVIDLQANKIIFEQEITAAGGVSALSPDGKHLAIFDRNKLAVYELQ